MRQGRQDGVDPAAARSGRAIDRAAGGATTGRSCANTHGMRMERDAATRRLKQLAEHTFVTTMLDAGVSLRDVQIAARHADPRTTMRYDRARKNLDRHPNYILAAYMASGT
jgi:integrase/recombinase XerD